MDINEAIDVARQMENHFRAFSLLREAIELQAEFIRRSNEYSTQNEQKLEAIKQADAELASMRTKINYYTEEVAILDKNLKDHADFIKKEMIRLDDELDQYIIQCNNRAKEVQENYLATEVKMSESITKSNEELKHAEEELLRVNNELKKFKESILPNT